MVGVNKYRMDDGQGIERLIIDPAIEKSQRERVREMKRARNSAAVGEALRHIGEACRSGENLMEPICEAVRREATLGEISDVFRTEFGVYTDPGWL